MLPNLKNFWASLAGREIETPPFLPKVVGSQGIDFATKAAELQRMLEEARALKAKGMSDVPAGEMVSGHYVPNWGGMAAGLGRAAFGGMREREATQQAAEVAAAQQAEQARLMGEMPMGTEATPEQPLVGPRPPVDVPVPGVQLGPLPQVEGPPQMLPAQPAKPPTMAELQAWATKLQKVNPKMADAVTGEIFKRQLESTDPTKDLQVVGDSIYNKRTGQWEKPSPLQVQRLQEARDIKMADLKLREDTARQRSEDMRYSADQRAAAAKEANDIRLEIAKMTNATREAIAASSQAGKEAKAAAGTPKEQAEAKARNAQVTQIDEALAAVDDPKAKGAFGLKQGGMETMGGPFQAAARAKLTDEQSRARNKVYNITGKAIHDRYGAALSKQEAARGESYLPSLWDEEVEIKRKLKGMKEFIQEMDAKYLTSKPITTVPGAAAAATGGAPAAGGWKLVP